MQDNSYSPVSQTGAHMARKGRKLLDAARPRRRSFYNSSRFMCQKCEVGGARSGRARFSLWRGAKSECVVGGDASVSTCRTGRKTPGGEVPPEEVLMVCFVAGRARARYITRLLATRPGTLKHVS